MHQFELDLRASWPSEQWSEVTVVVAVSGGADSVALLRGLVAIRASGPGRLIVGHFNHGLRPIAAPRDADFVAKLAEEFGLECEVGAADPSVLQRPGQDGMEAAARRARHDFLESLADRSGARFIASAHTANDQAETAMFRILRGTGVAGLTGIPRARNIGGHCAWIRPLLAVRRAEIEQYLADLGQTYCHDESNRDLKIVRNRIRHELIPRLSSDYHFDVVESLLRLVDSARETTLEIETLTRDILEQAVLSATQSRVLLSWSLLGRRSEFLIRESLRAIWKERRWPLQSATREHWLWLVKTLQERDDTGTLQFPDGVVIRRVGDELELSRP